MFIQSVVWHVNTGLVWNVTCGVCFMLKLLMHSNRLTPSMEERKLGIERNTMAQWYGFGRAGHFSNRMLISLTKLQLQQQQLAYDMLGKVDTYLWNPRRNVNPLGPHAVSLCVYKYASTIRGCLRVCVYVYVCLYVCHTRAYI